MRTRVSEHSRGSAREPEPLWPPRHAIVRPAFGNAITASRPLPRSHHPPPQYCPCSLRLCQPVAVDRAPLLPAAVAHGRFPESRWETPTVLRVPWRHRSSPFILYPHTQASTPMSQIVPSPNHTAARRLDPVASPAAMGNNLPSTQVRRDVYAHRDCSSADLHLMKLQHR